MSIHDIALSLQRKIRSEFPLSMLNEKDFLVETFLIQCFSGRSKDILENSKSLKKDLENLIESTEKSLSQKISQDFDKLISLPNMMLDLEADVSQLFKQSYNYSTSLENLTLKSSKIINKVSEKINCQKNSEKEELNAVDAFKLQNFIKETQEKLIIYKECANLPLENKLQTNYDAIAERISKLIDHSERIAKNVNHLELLRMKSEFLSILHKEILFWGSQTSSLAQFKTVLECYKILNLENEVQMILRDALVYPIVKTFVPQQVNIIDDIFDIDNFFQCIVNEYETGKFNVFIKFPDCCDILIKSLWKGAIKILLTKSKLFSPVFSQDYQGSLIKSIEFTENLASHLADPSSFRKSQDYNDFLEK